MYSQQPQALPVSANQIDTSTFSPNLPNHNDAVPQVQLPKYFQQNQQHAMFALGLFRKRVQDSAQKSAAHVVNYNTLSHNRFQNQYYQIQCQRVLDLAAILVNQMHPDQALDQAALSIAEGCLGTTWNTFKQHLYNMVPQPMHGALDQAAQRSHQIDNQIAQAKQQASYQPQMQQQQYNQYQTQQPYNQQMQQHAAFATTTGTFQPAATNSSNVFNNVVGTTVSSGMYVDTPASVTVQEFDSSNNQYSNLQVNAEPTSNTYVEPEMEYEYLDVSDIVIDPAAYPNENPQISFDDPYGCIRAPGGIVIEPAFRKPELSVTRGDDSLYTELYDPKKYIEFLVQYADGVIKSKVVEWTSDMDYLKHELDATLRGRYAVATDTVVVNTSMVGLINAEASDDSAVIKTNMEDLLADSKDLKDGLPTYLILDQVFTGASDLDNEMEVKEFILETFNKDEPLLESVLPPHEYLSMRTHTLDVDGETASTLSLLSTYKCFSAVAVTLKEMLRMTDLSVRGYNFINNRITKAINEYLKDSLSSDITIDDFVNDIDDLLTFLKEYPNPKLKTALEGDITRILKRAITVEVLTDSDEGTVVNAIVDNYVNLQTSWMLADLRVLPFKEGEAVMISRNSDKTLLAVLKALLQRHKEERQHARFRIITVDGVYLEIIHGRLVDNAMLLKHL